MKDYYLEESGEYKGYKYYITFIPLGYRCGYVAIPEGHRFYKVFWLDNKAIGDLDTPGGINYSNFNTFDDDKSWLLGFDCGHSWDRRDIKSLKKYKDEMGLRDEDVEIVKSFDYLSLTTVAKIRDINYVREGLKSLIEQIIEGD